MRADYFFHDIPVNLIRNSIIFLDIDGTLVLEDQSNVDEKALETIKKLQQYNEVYLCTNARNKERNDHVEEQTGLRVINAGIRKPNKKIIEEIPGPITKPLIVIGDKYLTDGLFARRIGAQFIRVRRLRGPVSFAVRAVYIFDDIVYFIASIF